MRNRIIYILPSKNIGGTERMLTMLADRINRYGFEPVIVTMQGKGHFHEVLSSHKIKYYVLDLKRNPFIAIIKAFYIFLKEKPCIVQSFLFSGNLFAKFLRFFFWKPLICSQRSTDNWKKPIHWQIEKMTDFLCCLLISNSAAGKKALIEKANIKPKKIIVIPNGIDIEEITKKLKPMERKQIHKDTLVGAVGNLRKAKGFDILITAASIVSKKRKDIKFVILGGGEQQSHLEALIKTLKLTENVSLCGFVENVYNYMVEFDMVVIPSRWEGFPVVALEAMVCGKPVIATDVGDLSEVVQHGTTGLIVEPEKPEKLADAILYLASNKKILDQMRENALRRVEKFSIESMV
ncbi:MAG: glycosyltransferase, partial [bacterium]|nr:glycosyltransferase [bacterium]